MDQVNVIFIPFSSSATVVHLADVTIRGSKSLYGIFFTGYHLILFEDNVDTSSDIRIFELSCGLTYIVHVELPLRTAQILDGTYLLIALPSGVVLGAPLSRFQSDIEAISFPLEDHPDYCVISSINPHDCRAALCLPRSSLPVRPAASTTPHLSDEVNRVRCPIWCISRVYYQYSDMPSVVMGTVPLAPAPTQTIHYSTAETLDARCALTSIPPTNTTPPTLSVPSTGICSSALPTLTDVSHDENQNNVLHRLGVPQICVAPFIRPAANTRITTLPHPFHPFGNFLLLNTLEPFETIRNRLVLSQIHHSPLEDPKIEHKVLTFQDRQGNIAPPCQNNDDEHDPPYRRSWYVLWNECTGIIAVVMEEADQIAHRVHLYQLGA
ncbi:hypothetical protein DL93DRAFT_2084499 [Clavulina sp. PMI_390]|nr:hypothetical protein DL93DRAFT_2084499 [Clavulina sp. PMI_390]